jgi:hypothetical protein
MRFASDTRSSPRPRPSLRALHLAPRRTSRGPRRHAAGPCQIHATLIDCSCRLAIRDVFADEQVWQEAEPLRHVPDIAGVPLGVWCGRDEPFVSSARQLVDAARPEVAAIAPGAHDGGYWLRVLPDMLRFVGAHVTA